MKNYELLIVGIIVLIIALYMIRASIIIGFVLLAVAILLSVTGIFDVSNVPILGYVVSGIEYSLEGIKTLFG